MRKIKSSRHSLSQLNKVKAVKLEAFLLEYKLAVEFYIDYIWNNAIYLANGKILNIKKDKFDFPKFISTTDIPYNTNLSARVLKSAAAVS